MTAATFTELSARSAVLLAKQARLLQSIRQRQHPLLTIPRCGPRKSQSATCISRTYEDALYVCVMVAQDYWDRGFGFSDMRIESFEGLVVQ